MIKTYINQKVRLLLATIALFAVASCGSSEPSESDIATALQNQIKAQLEQSNGMFDEEDITVRYIKKVGCSKAQEQGGYLCDVDIDLDVKLPFVGTQNQKGVQSLRFVKTDDGWNVVQ